VNPHIVYLNYLLSNKASYEDKKPMFTDTLSESRITWRYSNQINHLMKFNFGRLVLSYLLYYFFIEGALRDLLIRGQTDSFDLTRSIFSITSLFIFFLYVALSYAVLHRYYPSRKWSHCALGLIAVAMITISCRYFVEQILSELLFKQTNYPHSFGLKNYLIDNYFFAFRYITFGVIYYFVTYSLYKQRRESELVISKKNLEMALLKAQINPHFLLNSMNNIYSLVFHKSDQALPAMDNLTDILKYSLYESKDFETLGKEISIANQYIELSKLRTSFDLHYDIDYDEDVGAIQVPQHLLMPIVENVIKHGDLSAAESSAQTIINREGKQLHISSSNKVDLKLKDRSGGIGLSNLERRLQLLYESNYTMTSRIVGERYFLDIIIPVE